MRELSGKLDASGLKFGIVVSRFNEFITQSLLDGALDCLKRHGAEESTITTAWVPGAFEIPLIAKLMAGSGDYDAIICLGAVIRGETAHFDYVAGPAASGIAAIATETGIPVLLGVLTTESIEQAIARAGSKTGNKGFEVAQGAIEMANLIRELELDKVSDSRK